MSFRTVPAFSLKKTLLLLSIVFLSFGAYTQVSLDSLLHQVNYQKEDTTKAKLYYDIAKSYYGKDRSMFKVYTDSMFRLSRKLKYSSGIALSYAAYSFYYSYENDWEKVKYKDRKSVV